MNRYILSFFIASIVYISVLSLIFYQSMHNDCSHEKIANKKFCRVCFSVIKEQPLAKKVETKVENKLEKQIVKKEFEQKIEKIETPKSSTLQAFVKIAQESAHEKLKEEANEVKVIKKQKENIVQPEVSTVKKEDEKLLQDKKNRFISELITKINTNKSYPRMARREGIEGNVKIKFCISSDGNVNSMQLISGEKIFEKSAFEAIKKSFPIKVDEALFHFPKEFTITLAYALK